MRRVLMMTAALVFACLAVTPGAMAASWIASPELQGGGWVTVSGAGLDGANAYQGTGMDGTRRAYWKFDFADMPTTATLFQVYVYAPTGGNHGWQPIESQYRGVDGEQSMDPMIPWAGMWGTNHQYLGSDWNVPGTWMQAGPGPHGPESADYNAGPNGTYMWLQKGSWLYVKWDFGWDISNTVSAVKIVTVPVPEPSSLMMLAGSLTGLMGFALRRRK